MSEVAATNGIPSNNTPKVDKRKLKKKEKKKQKKKRDRQKQLQKVDEDNNVQQEDKVEIEYVVANPLEGLDGPTEGFEDFAKIFEKFNKPQEEEPQEGEEEEKPDEEKDEEKTEEETKRTISKKQLKREKRLSIAVLKTLVKRPDVVEAWDVTSSDPGILVYMKSYRNTVPVPRHWNQKRKYLQGKRGIEKPPFQLPDFIAATGISKIRAAIIERDDAKKLKTKQREKMQPKLGRMDIDYQVLHDAFFKYQTKPKLTIHGDLYYEGKEFEITLKEKRPGQLSDELKRALGMPEGAPPPWLINQQRYGPPPSYPNLKVPGLNAPIPDGARYGYHPGGWGKPPVDEFGRPLYGDVFGTAPPEPPPEVVQPIERNHWGEFPEEEEEEVEQEEMEQEMQEEEPPHPSGFETPSGFTTPSGMETPESLELRKAPKRESVSAAADEDDSNKQLFHVLKQTDVSVGGTLYGSSHKYVLPGEKKEVRKNTVDLMKSQATEKVDIALNPAEVEKLDELTADALEKKLNDALSEKKEVREDVSDLMAEHAKKKRKKEQKDSKSKKYKDFKF